jgi:hypothetical protein
MSSGYKEKASLFVFLVLSTAAFAKPMHLLYHASKSIAQPVRHPGNALHGLWKAIKVVF